jgi:hypothetical protein
VLSWCIRTVYSPARAAKVEFAVSDEQSQKDLIIVVTITNARWLNFTHEKGLNAKELQQMSIKATTHKK